MVAGFEDGTSTVYSLSADCGVLRVEATVSVAYGQILSACWHPKNQYFALGGENDGVTLFPLEEEGKRPAKNLVVKVTPQKTTLVPHFSEETLPYLSGPPLISCFHYYPVQPVCQGSSFKLGEVVTLKNHTSFVSHLGFHLNGRYLVSDGWDGRINFWSGDIDDIRETLQPLFRIHLVFCPRLSVSLCFNFSLHHLSPV